MLKVLQILGLQLTIENESQSFFLTCQNSPFETSLSNKENQNHKKKKKINICLFLDAEKSIFNFFFNFREYFYLFCNLFSLAKLQRGLEKKPQGEDRVHPWD